MVSFPSSSITKLFVGVYKHGIADACLLELEAANATIVYHNLAHQMMVFCLRVPLSDHSQLDGAGGVVPRGRGCFREELPMCFDVVFEPIHSYGRDLGELSALKVNGDKYWGSLDPLLDRILFRSPHVDPVIETKLCGRNHKFSVKKKKSDPVARENARRMLTKTIESERTNWDRAIDRPWRVTVEKMGDHGVSSVELAQDFGAIGTKNMPERGDGDQRAPVRMRDFELEVMIVLSHPRSREVSNGKMLKMGLSHSSVEPEAKARTTNAAITDPRVLLTESGNLDEDLWCFGIRLRRQSLLEKRGVEVTKTKLSVAAGICTLMLRELANIKHGEPRLTVLDPMCGHGTLPLVMHLMQQKLGRILLDVKKRKRIKEENQDQEEVVTMGEDGKKHVDLELEPPPPFNIIGSDAKDLSYAIEITKHFRDSLCQSQPQPMPTTTVQMQPPIASWIGSADTCRLPIEDSSIDCLVVDPPWGQRHGSHTFVAKNLRAWIFEWYRVLHVGGLLGIVTIRTNQMVRELSIEPFAHNLIACEDFPIMFNNSGYPQCMFFLLRKVR